MTRRQANIQMECNYDTICLPYHMTVGVSHDCPHLIGSDRILSLMPRNSTYFRQTYSFYIRLGTRLPISMLCMHSSNISCTTVAAEGGGLGGLEPPQ